MILSAYGYLQMNHLCDWTGLHKYPSHRLVLQYIGNSLFYENRPKPKEQRQVQGRHKKDSLNFCTTFFDN